MYSLDVEALDLCSNNRPLFQTKYYLFICRVLGLRQKVSRKILFGR